MSVSSKSNMASYKAARAEFRWDPPERYNFVRDVIDKWSADPDKIAILWVDDSGKERTITFAELAARSRRVCNALSAAGIQRGDTVVLVLARQVEWWEIVTACLRMGVVCSPGTTQLSPKDITYRVSAAGAVAVITDADNAPKVDKSVDHCHTLKARIVIDSDRDGWLNYASIFQAADEKFETADTAFEEDALCYFTSGTTGYPKMTIHGHGYALAHQISGRYWLDLRSDDVMWNISDTGWAKAAYSAYFGPWHMGAAIFVHHTATFDPLKVLDLLERYPITVMCSAPTVFRMLVQEDLSRRDFPLLRHCAGAGEPLNPEVIEVWEKATGVIIRDGYGQTETVLLCANYQCLEPRFGSMGRPAPGIDLAVIDEDGNPLPPDEEGDISVRVRPKTAPGLFTDYRGDAERYRACFRGDWYVTGDRGYVDRDGYFWFVSRADDVILSAGYRIGPFEVESALLEHAVVVESAVVASPDATRGSVVKAFVVLAPGVEAGDALTSELQEHVRQVTAPFKYPRRIEFVNSLPKTVSGKIRRIELREREEQAVRNSE